MFYTAYYSLTRISKRKDSRVMILHEICTKYYNDIYHHCLKRLNFNADAAAEINQQVFSVLCERWEEVLENFLHIPPEKTFRFVPGAGNFLSSGSR